MSTYDGITQAASLFGLESILIRPVRLIADFYAQVTFEEKHEDTLEITQQPVEVGARITDHSYSLPAQVTITCAWSNSPSLSSLLGGFASTVVNSGVQAGIASLTSGNNLGQVKQIYANLLALQKSRVPFEVVTGKRSYKNMLVKSLTTTTDRETENSLVVVASLQEVILVNVTTVAFKTPTEAQKNPEITDNYSNEGTKTLAPAPTYNAGAGRGSINPALVNGG